VCCCCVVVVVPLLLSNGTTLLLSTDIAIYATDVTGTGTDNNATRVHTLSK
jgi:hypothetical protein